MRLDDVGLGYRTLGDARLRSRQAAPGFDVPRSQVQTLSRSESVSDGTRLHSFNAERAGQAMNGALEGCE